MTTHHVHETRVCLTSQRLSAQSAAVEGLQHASVRPERSDECTTMEEGESSVCV
jgi:hypothetical protein